MTERVETGGLMKFQYEKGSKKTELSDEKKNRIRDAYAKAEIRKRREKRRRMMLILVFIIIIVGAGLAIFLK